MKRRRRTGFLLSVLSFGLFGMYALAQDGAYVLRVEAPFTNPCPSWLPLRVSVQVKDGKPVEAFASAQQLNVTWHEVDVTGLRLADGRLVGSMGLHFRRDDIQQTSAENGLANPKPNWRYSDAFMSFSGQVVQVDCPIGTLTGAAPGQVSWDKDRLFWLTGRGTGGTAKARAWREGVVDPNQPRHVELFLLRWTDKGQAGAYDGMYGNASLLLRAVVADGKASGWVVLQAPERYAMQYADLLWRVPAGNLRIEGDTLVGDVTIAPDREAIPKLGPLSTMMNSGRCFAPFPAQPLQVSLKARLIGATVAGTAQVQQEGRTVASMVLGQVRPFAHALHADRTPRTWDFSSEPDPALVAAAQKEAATPIRPGSAAAKPALLGATSDGVGSDVATSVGSGSAQAKPGEPGKRLFWSDAVRYGGYDVFVEDGKRIVQSDGGGGKPIYVVSEEEYRGKLKAAAYSGIAAPTFNLQPVPGAVKYRCVVQHQRKPHDPVEAFELSFEAPVPWTSLGPVWDKIPVHSGKSDCSPYQFIVTGLDAQGQSLGETQKVAFIKRASFDGPYHKMPRSYREAALLSARWLRDNPRNAFARLGVGEPGIGGAGGDGQLWYPSYGALYAGLALHQLSPDAVERADALEVAVVTGDLWLRSFMANYLPDTYKGWTFDQWVYGTAWLDLYRLTGDERYRAAVLEHARRLVAKQLPSGTWPDVEASNGHAGVDPKTGRPAMASLQGPSMQQWDPSSTLFYLGRIRKDLKTDEFKAAEDKACQWVMENSVARMDWRKQGPHASEDHKMPWPVLPDCALHFFHYLALDLPGRSPDWELMADLLRWSEDRVVNWGRLSHIPGKPVPEKHQTQVFPAITYIKNRDVQIRLAHAYAILAAHTGNPLHRAKSEALAGAVLVGQFPITGQIPHTPNIDTALTPWPGYAGPGSGDGGNRGEYATMALKDLAQLEGAR